MQTIERVTARNFKGRDFDVRLDKFNVIIGPSNQGKTSITEAIMLATLGHVPGVGRRNPDIFRSLASGNPMVCAVTLAGGALLQRTFSETRRGEKASYKCEAIAPDGFEMPVSVLDSAAFLFANDGDRVKAVFAAAHIDCDIATITARVASAMHNLDTRQIAALALKPDKDAGEGDNPQAWLEGALRRLKDERALVRAEAAKAQGAATTVTEMGAQTVAQCEMAISALKREMDTLRDTLGRKRGTLAEQRRHAASAKAKWEEWSGHRVTLKLAHAAKQDAAAAQGVDVAAPRSFETVSGELARLRVENEQVWERHRQQLAGYEAALAARQRMPELEKSLAANLDRVNESETAQADLPELVEACAAWESSRKRMEQGRAVLASNAAELETDISNLRSELKRLDALCGQPDAQMESLVRQRAAIEELAQCPTCFASHDGWREKALETVRAQIEARQREVEEARRERQAIADKARKELTALEGRKAEADDAVAIVDRELAAVDAARPASAATAQQLAGLLPERRAALQGARQLVEDAARQANEGFDEPPAAPEAGSEDRLRAELLFLESGAALDAHEQAEPPLPGTDFAADEGEIAGLESEVSGKDALLRQAQQELHGLQEQERIVASVVARRADLEAQFESLDGGVKLLDETRAELTARAFGPLCATLNQFTAGIVPPVELRDGRLGFLDRGAFVTLAAMGGAYRKSVLCGLQAALAAYAPVSVAIVDELGVMDADTRQVFLSNVQECLRAGVIGQFVGVQAVSATERFSAPSGGLPVLNMIRL